MTKADAPARSTALGALSKVGQDSRVGTGSLARSALRNPAGDQLDVGFGQRRQAQRRSSPSRLRPASHFLVAGSKGPHELRSHSY